MFFHIYNYGVPAISSASPGGTVPFPLATDARREVLKSVAEQVDGSKALALLHTPDQRILFLHLP